MCECVLPRRRSEQSSWTLIAWRQRLSRISSRVQYLVKIMQQGETTRWALGYRISRLSGEASSSLARIVASQWCFLVGSRDRDRAPTLCTIYSSGEVKREQESPSYVVRELCENETCNVGAYFAAEDEKDRERVYTRYRSSGWYLATLANNGLMRLVDKTHENFHSARKLLLSNDTPGNNIRADTPLIISLTSRIHSSNYPNKLPPRSASIWNFIIICKNKTLKKKNTFFY